MFWDRLSDTSSVLAFIGVIVILVSNIWLYKNTKLNPFLWYILAWVFAAVVRFYIMITDLFPTTFYFNNEVTIMNGLMSICYILIAIGSIVKAKAIYMIVSENIKNVLKGKA